MYNYTPGTDKCIDNVSSPLTSITDDGETWKVDKPGHEHLTWQSFHVSSIVLPVVTRYVQDQGPGENSLVIL